MFKGLGGLGDMGKMMKAAQETQEKGTPRTLPKASKIIIIGAKMAPKSARRPSWRAPGAFSKIV